MAEKEKFDLGPSLLTMFCASVIGALVSTFFPGAMGAVVITGMVCIATGHLMKEYKTLLVPAGTGFILGLLIAYTAEHYFTFGQSAALIATALV